MNRLGMLRRDAHGSATFRDTLAITTSPVVATHGNARALRDTPRYFDDDQLRAIAATGGLICPGPRSGQPPKRPLSRCCSTTSITWLALVGPDHVGFGTDFLGQARRGRPKRR